jgi:glucokinase
VGGTGEAIGVDVGGTKVNAFRVARDGTIVARSSEPTPAEDEERTLETMIRLASALRTPDVLAVGVGAAGLVDATDGVLRFAPNLAWRDVPIAARMRDALGLPCQVDNDANVAAYAEYRFGAGRGYRHMLLVTVGTGIGGGIVSDGRLFRGARSWRRRTSSSSRTARSAVAGIGAAGSRSPLAAPSAGWDGRWLEIPGRRCGAWPGAIRGRSPGAW